MMINGLTQDEIDCISNAIEIMQKILHAQNESRAINENEQAKESCDGCKYFAKYPNTWPCTRCEQYDKYEKQDD